MKKINLIILLVLVLIPINVFSKSLTNYQSLTFLRTKDEITDKYINSKVNSNISSYDVIPDINNYIEGNLSTSMQQVTAKKLNYLRWQYGLDDIYINESQNYLNQKCAMILSKLGFITHYPKNYADKLTDVPIEFLEDAAKGCAGGYGYSGNVGYASNGMMFDSPLGYVSDRYNLHVGVGHRLSIFDPDAYAFSMGYYNHYDAISVYIDNNDFDYEYLTWPNAGYAPIENLDPYEPWSILLNNKYRFTDNTLVTIYYLNNVFDIDYNIENYYNAISFILPEELLEMIVNSNNKYIDGTSLIVKISGIKENNEDVDISYSVNLFYAEEIDYNNLNFWYKPDSSNQFSWTKLYIDGEWFYQFNGEDSHLYDLKFEVDNINATRVGNFLVSIDDPNIANISNNSLSLKKNGKTYIKVIDDKTNNEFKYPIYVYNVKELLNYDIEIKSQDLIYNGEEQELISVNNDLNVYYSTTEPLNKDNYLNYNNQIPKAINAKTYNVYYYIPGFDNYNELIGSLEVTIKKANRDELIIHDYEGIYDDLYHTIEVSSDDVLYSLDNINFDSEKIYFKSGNNIIKTILIIMIMKLK